MNQLLVLCIGNDMRGDDAIGLKLAERLAGSLDKEKVLVKTSSGQMTAVMDFFQYFRRIVIVDAVVDDEKKPGTVIEVDALSNTVKSIAPRCSSHNEGVVEAIEMARVLNLLPDEVRIIGIVGKQFDMGTDMGLDVDAIFEDVLSRINSYVKA